MSNKDEFLEWFKTIAISTKGERYNRKNISRQKQFCFIQNIQKANIKVKMV